MLLAGCSSNRTRKRQSAALGGRRVLKSKEEPTYVGSSVPREREVIKRG